MLYIANRLGWRHRAAPTTMSFTTGCCPTPRLPRRSGRTTPWTGGHDGGRWAGVTMQGPRSRGRTQSLKYLIGQLSRGSAQGNLHQDGLTMISMISDWIDRIHVGDALETLREIPGDSVNLVICSPPYYRQRQYT